ncbi:MAG: methyltransferase domain-containing protein [Gammaproteobacteria bacterium]
MDTIKKIAKNTLSLLPNEGRAVKTWVRKLGVQMELALIRMSRYKTAEDLPDPRTVYWIDPARIEWHTAFKSGGDDWEDWVFPQRGHLQTVRGGDWDVSDLKVADMRICRAVDARINDGAPWAATDFYQAAVRQIESGHRLWECADRSGFDRRCAELDRLIESIAKAGYRESGQLGDSAGIDSSLGHQEIIINISRDGLPLFQDGRHRLAIARTLKIKKIPVQVLIRHAEWQKFRVFMQRMARGTGGAAKKGVLYQNPIHFDLSDIPFEHGCEDRWQAMAAHLAEGSGLALDIGCNLGYFCHGLERKGYSPVGVEYLPDTAYAARKIARAEQMEFDIVTGDIFSDDTWGKIGNMEFAVVVALNVFHHVIKTEAGCKRLERFIKRLNCRTMFFEPRHSGNSQIQNGYLNPSPAEFAAMIGEWGRFQSVVPIPTPAGSIIFMLGR